MKGNSAEALAETAARAYEEYADSFAQLTRKARERFEARDWLGAQRDAQNRLLLYGHRVDRAVAAMRKAGLPSERVGKAVKARYAAWCSGRDDVELAETFYNSIARRTFGIAGVAPALEFVGEDVDAPRPSARPIAREMPLEDAAGALRTVHAALPFASRMADAASDAALGAHALAAQLGDVRVSSLDVLDPVFYRGKGAYVVGRMRHGDAHIPLVLCYTHEAEGVRLDAVLTTTDEASIAFGFTRSYFHADVAHPRSTIDFLQSIMPAKRVDELYTSIGYNRHGKTELHAALIRHLRESDARFVLAPGEAGLVMSVFALPDFNVVFKVIRDRFGAPKRATRRAVMDKYNFIFRRDRVGRLADAQEFRHLELPRSAFSAEVLEEFRREAADTVQIGARRVVLQHLYTERRVTPLNLYLREAGEHDAIDAMLDYGNAIKDLAAANIFPGDMLFKNFGVTRHGRVIFYDYDEVEHLTDCVFRAVPQPRDDLDEVAAEPWYGVGEHDVFPEEFGRYMVLPGALGEAFRAAHADLLTLDFWKRMQARQRVGEVVDFYPYRPERRLRR